MSVAHLFHCSNNKAKHGEDVEVGWSRGEAAYQCLDDKRRHERLLATELVWKKPEHDGAEHDAKVEYHLRYFRPNVPVADKVPLA